MEYHYLPSTLMVMTGVTIPFALGTVFVQEDVRDIPGPRIAICLCILGLILNWLADFLRSTS